MGPLADVFLVEEEVSLPHLLQSVKKSIIIINSHSSNPVPLGLSVQNLTQSENDKNIFQSSIIKICYKHCLAWVLLFNDNYYVKCS